MSAVLSALLDTATQTMAVTAAWWGAMAVTVVVVIGVGLRLRKLRRQRRAQKGARTFGRLRVRAYNTHPGAADEEWQSIIAALEERDR